MTVQTCLDELLKDGLDDWVQAADVATIAQSIGGARTPEEIKDLSLRVIQEALERDLMTVGDVTSAGFRPWNVPLAEALERVEHAWGIQGKGPNLGEVCWLENTKRGDDRAGGR